MEDATRRGIRLGARLALAHHPLCGYFDADVFGRRVRLCQGCLATWPLFVLVLPVAWVAPVARSDPFLLVGLGVGLGLPQVVSVLWRGPRAWRIAAKACGGVGLALLVAGGLWLPVPMAVKLAFLGLCSVGAAGLLLLRARSILATCDRCPWQRSWEHCPGMLDTPRPEGNR